MAKKLAKDAQVFVFFMVAAFILAVGSSMYFIGMFDFPQSSGSSGKSYKSIRSSNAEKSKANQNAIYNWQKVQKAQKQKSTKSKNEFDKLYEKFFSEDK